MQQNSRLLPASERFGVSMEPSCMALYIDVQGQLHTAKDAILHTKNCY